MVGRIPTGVTENWPTSVAKAIRRKECRCHHDRTSELSVQRVVSFEPFKLSSVPLGR